MYAIIKSEIARISVENWEDGLILNLSFDFYDNRPIDV